MINFEDRVHDNGEHDCVQDCVQDIACDTARKTGIWAMAAIQAAIPAPLLVVIQL